MPQEFAVNEAQELRQQFQSWRRRFLFWKVVDSINLFVCCTLLAIVAIFAVDYAVAFPWIVRVTLVATVIAVAVVFATRVVRFLCDPPKFSALARSIQTQHTSERSNLIAAGMLLDESPELSGSDRATVQALNYARQQIRDWNWQAGIDRTKPLSWLVAFILMMIAAVFLWNSASGDVISQRWFSLLGSGAEHESTLTFINPPSSAIAGQSIRLQIKHDGPWKPESISLEIQGSVGEVSRQQSNAAHASTFEVSNVQSPLRVQARAGVFARSEYLNIGLRDRLKVLAHEFAINPPSYLKQSPYQSNKSDLSVAEHSKVVLKVSLSESIPELHLKANDDLGHQMSFAGTSNKSSIEFDLSPLADLETSVKNFNRTAGSVRYRMTLNANQDDQSVLELTYDLNLQVQADAPPSFVILNPPLDKPSLTLTEIGERLTAIVTDDYGIDSVKLTIRPVATSVVSAEQSTIESRNIYQRDPQSSEIAGLRSFNVDETLKREDMIAKWPTCNAIDCSLIATDIAGQQSTSSTVRLLLHKKDSEESQAIDAINSVSQLQRQLQKHTDQAARAAELSPEMREQLAAQQQAIRSKWQEANKSEQKKTSKQEQSVNSIEQLMRASQNNLKDGMLTESSNIQSGILHRLNDLAGDLQSDSSANRSAEVVRNLESKVASWSQQQSRVAEAVKDHLASAADPQSLETAQADESKLQEEIQQQLDAIEDSSPFAWPLAQANKSIARANAKLQRKMVDASTLADAQNAADMLKSLADNLTSSDQPSKNQSPSEETDDKEENQSASSVIQELEIVQSLQSRLHDRLQSIQDSQDSNNASSVAIVRSIAESQRELAQRTKKLSQTLSEK